MQLHRARNPRKSPLWRCAHRHFAAFVQLYPDEYQPRLGPLRPVIPQVVHKFLDCGNLDRGFARDDADRQRFVETLGEACAKTGWLHASLDFK